MKYPKTLPQTHKQLLDKIVQKLQLDPRIVGIGASGSYATDTLDKYSDLDLVIAVKPEQFEAVMSERFTIIESIEGKVAAFTGEHVGEPRLVIALYAPDAIHVDFKFVSLPDAAIRVDDTKVLWEQGTLLSDTFKTKVPQYPQPEPQWIEDRFWIWTHYAATKIARGEYFEALEFLSFLRTVVLSPLALKQANLTPSGVRKIETRLPEFSKKLELTVAKPTKSELIIAFKQCIRLYLTLREHEDIQRNVEAQKLCIQYLEDETRL
ncbi:nucleotidyltransferase domain-containing protein [Vibrio sp. 404]|uniref:Nucleotidyltransferase domain-containing protein n=1 Tax=Vibrio marinisediminis TaxID=2758441 RepID=A0A7W2FRX2_9VIBR|nr:nucleotidyltransferase domain-containing protein [Vibrio marinisediminis]MBA5763100.1 nucleotidyltransferase domain-containing protein [Vibrio marinisediminis]